MTKQELKDVAIEVIGKDPLLNIYTFNWGAYKLYSNFDKYTIGYLFLDRKYNKERVRGLLFAKAQKLYVIKEVKRIIKDGLVIDYDPNKFFVFSSKDYSDELAKTDLAIKVGISKKTDDDTITTLMVKNIKALTEIFKGGAMINYM